MTTVKILRAMGRARVLLLAGPLGAGKTTTAARIAAHPAWEHVSEDDHWVAIKAGHPQGELRTPAEERIVQAQVVERVAALVARRKNAVLEFILYEDPPRPLLNYQDAFRAREIDFTTRVLRPSVDEALRRMQVRGRPGDTNVETRRAEVEHQLRCLDSTHIQKAWVIDTSDLSPEEVYAKHFRAIVEGG